LHFLLQVRDSSNEVQGAIKHIGSCVTQINDFTGRVCSDYWLRQKISKQPLIPLPDN
jgi:hypothetical protein